MVVAMCATTRQPRAVTGSGACAKLARALRRRRDRVDLFLTRPVLSGFRTGFTVTPSCDLMLEPHTLSSSRDMLLLRGGGAGGE